MELSGRRWWEKHICLKADEKKHREESAAGIFIWVTRPWGLRYALKSRLIPHSQIWVRDASRWNTIHAFLQNNCVFIDTVSIWNCDQDHHFTTSSDSKTLLWKVSFSSKRLMNLQKDTFRRETRCFSSHCECQIRRDMILLETKPFDSIAICNKTAKKKI